MNKLIKRALFVFTVLTVGVVNAQTKTDPNGFEDLPWGSSIASVKAKFPNAEESNQCTDMGDRPGRNNWEMHFMQPFDNNCVTLFVKGFSFGGIPVKALSLYFNYSGGLIKASLGSGDRLERSSHYLETCNNLFEEVVPFLVSKYGSPTEKTDDKKPDDSSEKQSYKDRVWLFPTTEIEVKGKAGYLNMLMDPKDVACDTEIIFRDTKSKQFIKSKSKAK